LSPNIKSCTIQILPSAIFFTLYDCGLLDSRVSWSVHVASVAAFEHGLNTVKLAVEPGAWQQTAIVNVLETDAAQPALLVPVTVTVLSPAVGALIV
jgi:hypothetical protein